MNTFLCTMKVEVHQLTSDPTAAWREIAKSQRVIKITMKPPDTEIPPNKLRIVCMSDTHSLTPHIKFDVPDGDIFIHAGDFTKCGRREEVIEFNTWIGIYFYFSVSTENFILKSKTFLHFDRNAATQTQASNCWES